MSHHTSNYLFFSKIITSQNLPVLFECLDDHLMQLQKPIQMQIFEIQPDFDFKKIYGNTQFIGVSPDTLYQFSIDQKYFGKALKENVPVNFNFLLENKNSIHIILLPITHQNKRLGMITAYVPESEPNSPAGFEETELVMKLISHRMAMLIIETHAQLNDQDQTLNEMLKTVSAYSDDFWFLIDNQFKVHFANQRAQDEFDISLQLNDHFSFLNLIPDTFVHHFQQSNAQMLLTGYIKNEDMLLHSRTNEEIPVIYSGTVLKFFSKNHVMTLIIGKDLRPIRSLIQGLENSKIALESQNEILEEKINHRTQELFTHLESFKSLNLLQNSILENIQSGIVRLDLFLNIELCNTMFLRMINQETIDAKVSINHIPELEPLISVCHKVIQSIKPIQGVELELCLPKCTPLILSISVMPLFSPLKTLHGLLVILNDMTELKAIHKQLIQNERLGALGKMIISVAHEIRNPLNVIRGLSEMALIKNPNPEKAKIYSQKIINQIDRLETLLKEMLDYIKDRSPNRTLTNLNPYIANVLQMFQETFKGWCNKEISFQFNPCPEDLWVSFDQHQMEQVILNLIKNSVEAIENNGSIGIETFKNENEYGLRIKDDGNGIEDSQLEHIFEPFFTTKLPKGTGLGLSIVKNILQAHGGNIKVYSHIKVGTTFTLTLPLTDKEIKT